MGKILIVLDFRNCILVFKIVFITEERSQVSRKRAIEALSVCGVSEAR